jgi:hypothetical protein
LGLVNNAADSSIPCSDAKDPHDIQTGGCGELLLRPLELNPKRLKKEKSSINTSPNTQSGGFWLFLPPHLEALFF